jgi:hypothetical protein
MADMYEFYIGMEAPVHPNSRLAHGRISGGHKNCCLSPVPPGNRVTKKKKQKKSRDSATVEHMTSMQGRLDDLLQQGRRLRQQIELIAVDVDFPLTRESDGDPRLRGSNPSRPDPLTSRGHERADDPKKRQAASVRAGSRGRTGHT